MCRFGEPSHYMCEIFQFWAVSNELMPRTFRCLYCSRSLLSCERTNSSHIFKTQGTHTNRQVEHHIHIMTWKHLSSLLVNNFISIASEASIYLLLLTIFLLFLILHHPILILFLIADLVSSPSSLLWCSSPSSSSFFYSSVNFRNRRCFRAYIDIIVYSQNKR